MDAGIRVKEYSAVGTDARIRIMGILSAVGADERIGNGNFFRYTGNARQAYPCIAVRFQGIPCPL